MIILHLTDFHLKLQKQEDHQQSKIIDRLLKHFSLCYNFCTYFTDERKIH